MSDSIIKISFPFEHPVRPFPVSFGQLRAKTHLVGRIVEKNFISHLKSAKSDPLVVVTFLIFTVGVNKLLADVKESALQFC